MLLFIVGVLLVGVILYLIGKGISAAIPFIFLAVIAAGVVSILPDLFAVGTVLLLFIIAFNIVKFVYNFKSKTGTLLFLWLNLLIIVYATPLIAIPIIVFIFKIPGAFKRLFTRKKEVNIEEPVYETNIDIIQDAEIIES